MDAGNKRNVRRLIAQIGSELNDPDRRAAAKLLTKDEPIRIAANIAKLPELVRKT